MFVCGITPCYFTVDPTAPLPLKVTFGGPYTECNNECVAHGGAGVPGTFTFAPGDGDGDGDSPVVAYQYKLSSDSAWSAPIPGSTVTVTLTPPFSGTEQLQVKAEDTAARWGRTTSTSFRVA